MEHILRNWNILIEGMGPHSFDAIETQFTKWKIALLNTVSDSSGMIMLESAARNNNMRAFSFIFNEMREAQMPDDDGHTVKALEYALTYGNYNIAQALLSRKNLLFMINTPFKSPIYRFDTPYHLMKMNGMLVKYNDTTRINPVEATLAVNNIPDSLPLEADVSIDINEMPWIHRYFVAILADQIIPIEEITVYGRFYYKKYVFDGADSLRLEYVYTSLLIEALEFENMPMVDLLIKHGVIHCADIEYLEEQIKESRLYDTRIMLYKEILEKLTN